MIDGAPERFLVDGVGLWRQTLTAPETSGGPALFLDRDGVLLEEIGYLHKVEEARLVAGAADLVRAANQAGVPVVVVTNQAGVGRGYYDWAAFAAVQDWLVAALAAEGAHLDMVLACGYHTAARPPFDKPDHAWRKPRPGMLEAAAETLPIDLAGSWIVGDRASDLAAGRAAGLAGGSHIDSGLGEKERAAARAESRDDFAAILIDGLTEIIPRVGALARRP